MTNFEKYLLVILAIAICIALVALGYHIGNNNNNKKLFTYSYYDEYNCALAQRDRLADYLHTYIDMQDNESNVPKLSEVIETMEREDNFDTKIPPMNSNQWCFYK